MMISSLALSVQTLHKGGVKGRKGDTEEVNGATDMVGMTTPWFLGEFGSSNGSILVPR